MILDLHSDLAAIALVPGVMQRVETASYVALWSGVIFISDLPPGRIAVDTFLFDLDPSEIQNAAKMLKGVFFLAIQHKQSSRIHAFIDNSGLFKAFYTSTRIGDSFLELIAVENLCASEFEPARIIEFLELGNIYFSRTFSEKIHKISHDDLLSISLSGRVERRKKSLSKLSEPRFDKLPDVFQQLATSFRSETLSIDLTGGFDSRLVACLFAAAGLRFETALSGSPSFAEFRIARLVAKRLGVPFFEYSPPLQVRASELDELFDLTDGMSDLLQFRRIARFQRDRMSRGVTLAISGMGGEMFKDFWWIHEFPFYKRKHSNIRRLFNLRIMPEQKTTGLLAEKLERERFGMKEEFIDRLESYIDIWNTRTYDNVSYLMKMQEFAGCNLTKRFQVAGLQSYAPLLEYDVVRIAYSLPRTSRIFNSYHRALLSKCCPTVARIVTTEGFSASSKITSLPVSALGYASNKARRLITKMSQRLGGRILFAPNSPDDPLIAGAVRASPEFEVDLRYLKEVGIVSCGVDVRKIRSDLVGRLMTLARLHRRLS